MQCAFINGFMTVVNYASPKGSSKQLSNKEDRVVMKFGYNFIVLLRIPIAIFLSARGLFRDEFTPLMAERSSLSEAGKAAQEANDG